MPHTTLTRLLVLLVAVLAGPAAAQTGTIRGVITDANSGDRLPGATVVVEGTTIGAATSVNGEYRIAQVPAGRFVLIFSYIGYEALRDTVSLAAGQTLALDKALHPEVIRGQEVEITAQAEGQQRAIAQQLASNTIVNVVSAERIQELPDNNAAESLGRLPGVSVQRDGGEAQKIVIRGLSPRFNAVTVNGERLPSTDGNDRSVDLSALSPDQLAGIEVFKALTPDKDGDAIGGTVNFVIGRAQPGFRGDARFQYGYASQAGELGAYRGSLALSDRYFGNRLGVALNGNLQRADRSADELGASYLYKGENLSGTALFDVDDLSLTRQLETRDRVGAGLTLDLNIPGGSLLYNASLGQTDRTEDRFRKRYRVGESRVEYDYRNRETRTLLLTNSLSGTHAAPWVVFDWRGSVSRSLQRTPDSPELRFRELSAFNGDLIADSSLSLIPLGAKNLLDQTFLQESAFERSRVNEQDYTLQGDLRFPFQGGYLKLGAKHRGKERTRDNTRVRTNAFETREIGLDNPDRFTQLFPSGEPLLADFIQPGGPFENFLDDSFDIDYRIDPARAQAFPFEFLSYHDIDFETEADDYDADERITAGYVMVESNITPWLMMLNGFRYEHTRTSYRSFLRDSDDYDDEGNYIGVVRDTTGSQSYGDLLPMTHIRIKPAPWFDVRLAYTRTLARPNYFNLVPFERVRTASQEVERGNPELLHTKAENYDVFLSLTGNRIGLLSFGVFYKELRDLDVLKVGIPQLNPRVEYFNFKITEAVNIAEKATVRGFEVDWQTNFLWLPKPFDGLLLNANYAFIDSKTFIPVIEIRRTPTLPPRTVVVDSLRSVRVPGQPRHVGNLSVGYEKGGFSGRVSLVVQDNTTDSYGNRQETDSFDDFFARWDLAVNQRLTRSFSVFLNMNNFNNSLDRSFVGSNRLSTEQQFGWTGDLGLRYRF